MRIGIIGTGKVASSLAEGFTRTGHEVALGSRNPTQKESSNPKVSIGTRADASKFGEVVVLAIPYSAVKDSLQVIGPNALVRKVLVDATNAFPQPPGWAASTSCAEEIAKLVPGSKVVKAFNTVFAPLMATGQVKGTRVTTFVAGDDPDAKRKVMDLATGVGFDAVDAGPLSAARHLEPMMLEMISLAYGHGKMGSNIGLSLVR